MNIVIDILLVYCAVINILLVTQFTRQAVDLWKLYRNGENGITRLMAMEHTLLAVIWLWNVAMSAKNLTIIGLVADLSYWRLFSLVWIAVFYTALLATIWTMQRRLLNGSH